MYLLTFRPSLVNGGETSNEPLIGNYCLHSYLVNEALLIFKVTGSKSV